MSLVDALCLYLAVGGVVALCVELISGQRLPPSLAVGLAVLWPWALWRGFCAAVDRERRR